MMGIEPIIPEHSKATHMMAVVYVCVYVCVSVLKYVLVDMNAPQRKREGSHVCHAWCSSVLHVSH